MVQNGTHTELLCFSKAKDFSLFQVFNSNIGYTFTRTSKLKISL